ncbi:MAG: chemotaxis protein CheW [Coriobacteriia bacterium]|nr:chemotaxis protein CheW [Coriobacteriia bacterium]
MSGRANDLNVHLGKEKSAALGSEEQAARGANVQYVVFSVADQHFGLRLEHVLEVQPIVGMSAATGAATGVIGIVDLRGEIVPAVDLAVLLGVPSAEKTLDTPMVFATFCGEVIALVVDAVEDVFDLSAAQVREVPHSYPLSALMESVARLDKNLVYMLSAEQLFRCLSVVA